jgi:hypothetical protein
MIYKALLEETLHDAGASSPPQQILQQANKCAAASKSKEEFGIQEDLNHAFPSTTHRHTMEKGRGINPPIFKFEI